MSHENLLVHSNESVTSWFVYEIHSVTFAYRRASDTWYQSSECICSDRYTKIAFDSHRTVSPSTKTGNSPRGFTTNKFSPGGFRAGDICLFYIPRNPSIIQIFREFVENCTLYNSYIMMRKLWWPCNTIKWWIYPTWWWWFNDTNLSYV